MNQLLLEGKNAIVTGASYGIGRAISELYAQEGCNVVMLARGKEKLDAAVAEINAKNYPGKVIGITGDVSNPETAVNAFVCCIDNFGHVDVLVNNAGFGEANCIENTTDEVWHDIIAANQNSVFYFCREAAKHMLPRGEGSIINVGSVNGLLPVSGFSYGAAKGALVTMTKNLAMRFAGTGIRCNCMCPGTTYTPANIAFFAKKEEAGAPSMKMFGRKYVNESIDYLTQAIDQAYLALFLACDWSRYMTGAIIPLDRGGYMCGSR